MKRSKFNLGNYKLLTGDMGKLYPCQIFEVLPGDTIQCSSSVLMRLSPLVAPVMHPVHVRLHSFFVPFRILWDGWESFITGGQDGEGDGVGNIPAWTSGDFVNGGLYDYFGMQEMTAGAARPLTKLPARAYNKIFNEYYRDQDLVTEVTEDSTAVQTVAWGRDNFTQARPWPQKGPEVTLPLGTQAPVIGIGKSNQTWTSGSNVYETGGTGTTTYASAQTIDPASANSQFRIEEDPDNAGFPGIYADLSEASSVDVNQVRLAFALQRYQEARARYGSRYTDYLAYLGVRSSDARLQRPEYLGGAKQTISFSEVLQTGVNYDGNTGVGTLRGHGIAASRSRPWRRFFEEHGYVITLVSVLPVPMYGTGGNRMFWRQTKEDFWQRELEHIGQQEIYNRELFIAGTGDDGVFGYSDRYSEYRETPSTIAGEFRTSAYNSWHLARIFGATPTLNASFVTADPAQSRIFASVTNDTLQMMASHRVYARRLVSRNAGGKIL